MESVRQQINRRLDALIEAQRGVDFQRLAHQCLRTRWPSLAAVPEQADLGEDSVTILGEDGDGIRRSLLCSLTGTLQKVQSDVEKLSKRKVRVEEIIFATPKSVTRRQQEQWASAIQSAFGYRLTIVDRSELVAALERPESLWICREYLGLISSFDHVLHAAESLKKQSLLKEAMRYAELVEREALVADDNESVCRALVLEAHVLLDQGFHEEYGAKGIQALQFARDDQIGAALVECLILRANFIASSKPAEAHRLLKEAEVTPAPVDRKIRRWLLSVKTRVEEGAGDMAAAQAALSELETLFPPGEKADRQGIHYLRFRIALRRDEPSAFVHLGRAVRAARQRKRWTHAADFLHEKAMVLAKRGDFKSAAAIAAEAAREYQKAGHKNQELSTALLAAQLYYEGRMAEPALELANFVLQRVDATTERRVLEDVWQIKTRALQALCRVEEALEANQGFREVVALHPHALVSANAQEAMLYLQQDELEKAASLMEKSLEQAHETGIGPEFIAAMRVHMADIRTRQTRFRDVKLLIEQVLPFRAKLPPRVHKDIDRIVDLLKWGAPITSEYERFLAVENPLELAGTSECVSIRAAHQKILQMLLEWTSKWPKAAGPIYDFWGRGNLARFVLNHRGLRQAWHVTVEVKTVSEARHWARVLCPLVDVLTILWKGPIETGMSFGFPVHHAYDGPGGWGYMIAAGDDMRPDDDPNDWNWSPAMGEGTYLPKDALDFLFHEARGLLEAGRLFLFPAANVGCVDANFGPLERMFNDAVNAVPYLSGVGSNGHAMSLASFPLPYFPEIPLSELAIMIEGEEESLLQTRLELRSWARSIAGEEATPGREMEHDLRDRIDSGLRALERRYADIGRRLEWASAAGAIRSYALRPERLEIEPKNMAAAELVALHSELHASALHAFFRVTSAGYRWDLTNAKPSKGRGPGGSAKTKRPDKVFHWLVPPKPGWTIPVAVLG